MTITTTIIKNSYSGNGSQTVFPYTFKINTDADIQVLVRSSLGNETLKTLHYIELNELKLILDKINRIENLKLISKKSSN